MIDSPRREPLLSLLFLGAGCFGVILLETLHFSWRLGRTIPVGRGDLAWLGLGLGVGFLLGRKAVSTPAALRRWRRLLLAFLFLPLVLQAAYLWGVSNPGWGWLGGAFLAAGAGVEIATLARLFQDFDLQGDVWFEPRWLLWGFLTLALPSALLPYFGPLPAAASLIGALALWLAWALELDRRLAGLVIAAPWMILTALPGWFLSDPGFLPISSAQIQGQTFRLQTERRVDLLRVSGPGGWFLSMEAHRWAEALVHPTLSDLQGPATVLLLGGEEGMALREILRSPAVASIQQIALRPARLRFFATEPLLQRLHRDSFRDPRLRLLHTSSPDILSLLDVLSSLPSGFAAAFLAFDEEATFRLLRSPHLPLLLTTLRSKLRPSARLAISAGLLPSQDPRPVACPLARLRSLGFSAAPYRVPGLDATLGFLWASPSPLPPPSVPLGLRYLTPAILPLLFVFPNDLQPERIDLSTCPSST